MKSTNFDYNGGFPFDQSTLKRLQEATFEFINVYARQLGCEDIGNYIIYGCQIAGSNITPGVMFIDGEICPFAGAAGGNTTKIKKQVNTTNAAFENGTNPPVFIETIAVVNAAGTELSGFTRFNYVQDANYTHTDNNFTTALKNKLNALGGADWTQNNPASYQFIANKPVGLLQTLHKGSSIIGDINGNDDLKTINFPSVGTSDYFVVPTFLSLSTGAGDIPGWNQDNDFSHIIVNKNASSFQIGIREYSPAVQNIKVEFLIIKNS